MIQFPEQRIARESPVSKLWLWWTSKGWSWDVRDSYQSFTITNGQTLRLPFFFDRHDIKCVDVFQIWLFNIKPVSSSKEAGLWARFFVCVWVPWCGHPNLNHQGEE